MRHEAKTAYSQNIETWVYYWNDRKRLIKECACNTFQLNMMWIDMQKIWLVFTHEAVHNCAYI